MGLWINDKELYVSLSGLGIKSLPNIRISLPPLMDVGLHDFANYPKWVFRASHKGFRADPVRPKVGLFYDSSGRGFTNSRCFLTLRMPPVKEYKSVDQFKADLVDGDWEIGTINLRAAQQRSVGAQAPVQMDDLSVIERMNSSLEAMNNRTRERLENDANRRRDGSNFIATLDNDVERIARRPVRTGLEDVARVITPAMATAGTLIDGKGRQYSIDGNGGIRLNLSPATTHNGR